MKWIGILILGMTLNGCSSKRENVTVSQSSNTSTTSTQSSGNPILIAEGILQQYNSNEENIKFKLIMDFSKEKPVFSFKGLEESGFKEFSFLTFALKEVSPEIINGTPGYSFKIKIQDDQIFELKAIKNDNSELYLLAIDYQYKGKVFRDVGDNLKSYKISTKDVKFLADSEDKESNDKESKEDGDSSFYSSTSDDSESSSDFDFTGRWLSECTTLSSGGSYNYLLVVKEKYVVVDEYVYPSVNDCLSNPSESTKISYTYELKGEDSQGNKKLEFKVSSLSYTPIFEVAVDAANTYEYYGESDWESNISKPVQNKKMSSSSSSMLDIGAIHKSIVSLDGNTLKITGITMYLFEQDEYPYDFSDSYSEMETFEKLD